MGRLVVVQQAMNDRAAAGVDGSVVPTDGLVPVDCGDDQQWPPPPPRLPPQFHGQAHGQARQTGQGGEESNSYRTLTDSASSRSDGDGSPQAWNSPPYAPQRGQRRRQLQLGQLIHSRSRRRIIGSQGRKACRYTRYSSNSNIQAHHAVQAPRGRTDQARVLVTSQTPLTGRHSSRRHTAACGTSRSNSSRETAPDS
jgi:hypothetical protein